MALLTFPTSPINGDYFPVLPLPGQSQYQWSAADVTWRLQGVATGVIIGTYGDARNVGQFTVDAVGRITFAQNVPIAAADWTAKGELAVGTGPLTQTVLSPGIDTSVLVTDSASASGLSWSDTLLTAALLPRGQGTERPVAPIAGQIRYNTTDDQFEGYLGATPAWEAFSTMPTGGVTATNSLEKIFYLNDQVIAEDYTVPAAKNAMTAGPIAISAGVTVTVSPGATWVVV